MYTYVIDYVEYLGIRTEIGMTRVSVLVKKGFRKQPCLVAGAFSRLVSDEGNKAVDWLRVEGEKG